MVADRDIGFRQLETHLHPLEIWPLGLDLVQHPGDLRDGFVEVDREPAYHRNELQPDLAGLRGLAGCLIGFDRATKCAGRARKPARSIEVISNPDPGRRDYSLISTRRKSGGSTGRSFSSSAMISSASACERSVQSARPTSRRITST
jgi:hypothetical protein